MSTGTSMNTSGPTMVTHNLLEGSCPGLGAIVFDVGANQLFVRINPEDQR